MVTPSDSQHVFFKNVVWQYGLQILRYFFPFLLIPYLTRVLGTNGYAVYAYVLSFMGIMQTITDFGFTLYGTRQVAANRNNSGALSKLMGSITLARLMLSLGLCCVLCAISQAIPIMRANIIYVVLAYAGTALRAFLPDFIFQGFENMRPLTTRYFASKAVTVVSTLVLVRAPEDLLWVAFADIFGGVVALGWSFLTIGKLYKVHFTKVGIKSAIAELKSSSIYCISDIGSTLVSGFTTFMVGVVLTNPVEIAYWSLALTTVSAVQALYAPFSNSLYSYVVVHHDLSMAKCLSMMAAPALFIGTIAYCLLSKSIFLLLGGEQYVPGSWVMVALSPMLPLSFYSILVGWPILGAIGKVKELTGSTVISGLVNVMVLFILNILGLISLKIICFVRCFAEFVLLASRLLMLFQTERKPKSGLSG